MATTPWNSLTAAVAEVGAPKAIQKYAILCYVCSRGQVAESFTISESGASKRHWTMHYSQVSEGNAERTATMDLNTHTHTEY